MKDLARFMVRNGLPPRRTSTPQNQVGSLEISRDVQQQAEKVPEIKSPYAPLDSWRPNLRAEQQRSLQAEVEPELEPYDRVSRGGRKPIAERKRRGVCLSMSVSPEEAELMRRHAATLGLTFSEWARAVLFDKMGRKTPKRPGAK